MSHDAEIVAQFTKMADAFASSPRIVSRMQKALGHTLEHARDAEQRVRAAIRENMLDTDSCIDGDETIFSYPIALLSARKHG